MDFSKSERVGKIADRITEVTKYTVLYVREWKLYKNPEVGEGMKESP